MGFSNQNRTKTTSMRAKATDLVSPKAKCCFTQPYQSWAQTPLPNPGMLGTALLAPGTMGTASPALPALCTTSSTLSLSAPCSGWSNFHCCIRGNGLKAGTGAGKGDRTRVSGTATAWAAGCRDSLASEHLSRDQ